MAKPAYCSPFVCLAALLMSTGAWALAQRTFVASYGNDASACSVTAPCRSFAAAIVATLAGGEVVVLDSAGYGPVTITKSVSITAPSGIYAGIFAPGVFGVTVDGVGIIVALRGLTMNGLGGGIGGIDFVQGSRLDVENCLINGFGNAGILLEAPNSYTYISDSTVRYSAPGIEVDVGEVTMDRVRLENNANGGLRVSPTTSAPVFAVVRDLIASQNGQSGVTVSTGAAQTARLVVERSTVSRSTGGFVAGGSGTTTMIVRDSSAVENIQSGILADSTSGAVTVVVSGTTSSRNGGHGFEQNGVAVLRTLQNNTVELNALGPTLGSITPASVQ